MKKVSVCMLAYNVGKHLSEAIESVLLQKINFEIELVIAEDKSTDDARKIAEEYKLKYPQIIKLVLNPVNIGMSANYINAFRHCSAPYIAVLDGDDYWCDPYKLQRQIDFLEKNPEYGMVYSDCKVIDMNGQEIEWDEMNSYRKEFASGSLFFSLLEMGGFIPMATTCFRKSLIAEELERCDLWFFEDWWLWMRIAMKSKFYFLNSVTACYRLHQAGITTTRIKDAASVKLYKKKCYTIYYSNVLYFYKFHDWNLLPAERKLIFRKTLMLLFRRHGSVTMKMKLLPLFFKYYPGIISISDIISKKLNK